jgi:hypothetical protein
MSRLSLIATLAVAALGVTVIVALGLGDTTLARRSNCPGGTQKFVNVCIETDDRGVGTFVEASTACAADRRRLPTAAELESFRQQPGITIGESDSEGYEWTGDLSGSNTSILVNDQGGSIVSGYSSVDSFRCVK